MPLAHASTGLLKIFTTELIVTILHRGPTNGHILRIKASSTLPVSAFAKLRGDGLQLPNVGPVLRAPLSDDSDRSPGTETVGLDRDVT